MELIAKENKIIPFTILKREVFLKFLFEEN